MASDRYASWEDFLKVAGDLEERLSVVPAPVEEPQEVKEPSPPVPVVDDSISEADIKYADHVYGLPQGEGLPEARYIPSMPVRGIDPGLSLNPDENIIQNEFAEVLGSGFGLVRGPKQDPEVVERELGNSYGG